MIIFIHQKGRRNTHKNRVVTKITLTISNAEHLHTLNTNKPHQQHLQENSQIDKTSLELYRWQFDMKEIPALFNNYCIRAFKQLH